MTTDERRNPGFLGYSHAGTRDLYASFGYPRIVALEELFSMYLRNDIANRIIRAFPQATWRKVPTIRDDVGSSPDKESAEYSPFVENVEKVMRDRGYYRLLERADRLASLGRFGIIVFGIGDGKKLNQPLLPGKWALSYVHAYSELDVTITKYDMNPSSARFGLPELYQVARAPTQVVSRQTSVPQRSFTVHHTRVLHLTELLDQDEVYGTPRLLPVFNRLKDLEKVVGGSAEAYWLNVSRIVMLMAEEGSNLTDAQIDDLKDQAEEVANKLRRFVVGEGVSSQVIGAESERPGEHVDKLLDLIAGAIGIPKRILIGNEAGQLASTQDDDNWSKRIEERRDNYAAPAILLPFVRKLIDIGVVLAPTGDFWCEWDGGADVTPVERATIATQISSAISTYANTPDAQLVMPLAEFREKVLGVEAVSEYEVELPEIEELPPELDEPEIEEPNPVANKKTPLYVHRKVLNASSIKKWARESGIKGLVDDLHVTLCYSKGEVDWNSAREGQYSENITIDADPKRSLIIGFGPNDDALVLAFMHDGLEFRNRELKIAGAVSDYDNYIPHITLSYEPQSVDLGKVKAYDGAIVLGPEVFTDATTSD